MNLALEFDNVSFGYTPDKLILKDVSLKLETGKTYALVGPTGGGKSTTASLMARLFDPISGNIRLNGRSIQEYSFDELYSRVGFILQEPYLFSGTVQDNITYGNSKLIDLSKTELKKLLVSKKLDEILHLFPDGLSTEVITGGENLSLGQRQLVSFIRIILREPQFLILDEATANIDTVTEQLLGKIIDQLPKTTTKVVIAHRLNTIKKANSIYFVGGGQVQLAQNVAEVTKILEAHNTKIT